MSSTIFHGTNHGIQMESNYGSIFQLHSTEDIDQLCIRSLRCPNSLDVKNHLKETKDKLLRESFEWVLQDPNYLRWRSGKDVCLLWIKGGAGQGKTMMSIGLIEELCQEEDQVHSVVVTYFFCQNANNELNTLESLVKGLILRLVSQRSELKESLWRRWDSKNGRFEEDMTSWRALWNILLEMLDLCASDSSKIYVVVDAIDECQDSGMADLLKLIVRHGLDRPTKLKWLLTSRPLKAAERALLSSHDQLQVSLDLNSKHVSQSVQSYISFKVDELNHQNARKYDEALVRKVKDSLSAKTEGTFLWVSLACERLEGIHPDNVLAMIQDLPPGLHLFYDRMLQRLNTGPPEDARQHMRLLKVMMLAYRPLSIIELSILIDLTSEDGISAVKELVDRCASFVKMRKNNLEFIHQSARDYLASDSAVSILELHESFGHYDVVLHCLDYLSENLRVNLMGLPQPDSTPSFLELQKDKGVTDQLSPLAYAATFWLQHLQNSRQATLTKEGPVGIFLRTKFLEWLECLSLLDRLPEAIPWLQKLIEISEGNSSISPLAQDAFRFLKRHYNTVAHWPLQTYSSALLFTPESSCVRIGNLNKLPQWIQQLSPPESTWTPLLQTLSGHSDKVRSVAFSPDGTHIASGSWDETVKLWDTNTGSLHKTLQGHSATVNAVAFSPDGTQIVSGSTDRAIKLWDVITGNLQMTLQGHSGEINAVAFSPCGIKIASGSSDRTIKLWDVMTGNLWTTLKGHSGEINAVAFSPDGIKIASGSSDRTIKLWDATTGNLRKTLQGHFDRRYPVAFSPDGIQFASGSSGETIKLWDTATGDLQRTIEEPYCHVDTLAFSPDSTQVASSSSFGTIKLWDRTTGQLQKTFGSPSGSRFFSLAFSPNGTQIVSGSWDNTIQLWSTATTIDDPQKDIQDCASFKVVYSTAISPDGSCIASSFNGGIIRLQDFTTGNLQKTIRCCKSDDALKCVHTVEFSPDGKLIASGSWDGSLELWDATTGDLQLTLQSGGQMGADTTLVFSPSGNQLASAHLDGTIKLWVITTGELQKTLKRHSNPTGVFTYSHEGTHIAAASSFRNQATCIEIWHIAKPPKATKFLGRRLASQSIHAPQKKIMISGRIRALEFSADDQSLITDIGLIELDHKGTKQHICDSKPNSLQRLSLKGLWICYGTMPIVHLPSDVAAFCHAVRGDKLAIGVEPGGQVLRFIIDRRAVHLMLLGSSPVSE